MHIRHYKHLNLVLAYVATSSLSPESKVPRIRGVSIMASQATSAKVILIGAGVAGPVLATFLKLKGYDPVVYERTSGPANSGVGHWYVRSCSRKCLVLTAPTG